MIDPTVPGTANYDPRAAITAALLAQQAPQTFAAITGIGGAPQMFGGNLPAGNGFAGGIIPSTAGGDAGGLTGAGLGTAGDVTGALGFNDPGGPQEGGAFGGPGFGGPGSPGSPGSPDAPGPVGSYGFTGAGMFGAPGSGNITGDQGFQAPGGMFDSMGALEGGNPSPSPGFALSANDMVSSAFDALGSPADIGFSGMNTGGAFANSGIGFGINGGPGFGGPQASDPAGYNVDAASNLSPGFTGFQGPQAMGDLVTSNASLTNPGYSVETTPASWGYSPDPGYTTADQQAAMDEAVAAAMDNSDSVAAAIDAAISSGMFGDSGDSGDGEGGSGDGGDGGGK